MRLSLECQGFVKTEAIDAHARAQVRETLRHQAEHIQSVDLYLHDESGPGGPEEFSVTACVRLRGMPNIAVKAHGCELYLTVRHAVRRAQRSVARNLRRRRRFDSVSVRRVADVAALLTPVPATHQLE